MDKFEEKELKKEGKIVKDSWDDWYSWLISYITKPIKKQINPKVFLSQTKLYTAIIKPKIQKESKDKIIKNVRYLFKLQKKLRQLKKK